MVEGQRQELPQVQHWNTEELRVHVDEVQVWPRVLLDVYEGLQEPSDVK